MVVYYCTLTQQEGFHEEVFEPAEQADQVEVLGCYRARYGKRFSRFRLAGSPERSLYEHFLWKRPLSETGTGADRTVRYDLPEC